MLDDFAEPHDDHAERAVLGAVLTGCAMDDIGLDDLDFYQEIHGDVWNACRRIAESGRKPDPVLVHDLDGKIDMMLLADLVSAADIASNVKSHARIVAQHSDRRWLINLSRGMLQRIDQDPASVAEFMRVKLDERNRDRQGVKSLGEVIPGLLDEISAGGTAGAASPWSELDDIIGGLQPGRLYTIGARPGRGKSLAGQAFAANVASRQKRSAFVASLEMTASEYAKRFLAADSSVRMRDMDHGSLDGITWDRLGQSTGKLSSWPVWINDSSRQDLASIRADARAVNRKHPLGVIVIDYLQLVTPADSRLPRHEQVGQMTRNLKRLAKELHVPVILLAQLNRNSTDGNRKPRLDDLRESGDIEQDSDVVILLHDPQPDAIPSPQGAELVALVEKNRGGPRGVVDLLIQGAFARIVQPMRQEHR